MANISTYVGAGGGGATAGGESLTATTCIALTSDNSSALEVCYSGDIGCLYLPNATTLESGTGLYTVKNIGTNATTLLYDYCQNLLNTINPETSVQVSLYDNTTAAGSWTTEKPLENNAGYVVQIEPDFSGVSFASSYDWRKCNSAANKNSGAHPDYYWMAAKGPVVATAVSTYNSSTGEYSVPTVCTCTLTAPDGSAYSSGQYLCEFGTYSLSQGGLVSFLKTGHILSVACDGTLCVCCLPSNICALQMNNSVCQWAIFSDCISTVGYNLPICGKVCASFKVFGVSPTTGALTCLGGVDHNVLAAFGPDCDMCLLTNFNHERHHMHFYNTVRCRIDTYKVRYAQCCGGYCTCVYDEFYLTIVPCDGAPGTCYCCRWCAACFENISANGGNIAVHYPSALSAGSQVCGDPYCFHGPRIGGRFRFFGKPDCFAATWMGPRSESNLGFWNGFMKLNGGFCAFNMCFEGQACYYFSCREPSGNWQTINAFWVNSITPIDDRGWFCMERSFNCGCCWSNRDVNMTQPSEARLGYVNWSGATQCCEVGGCSCCLRAAGLPSGGCSGDLCNNQCKLTTCTSVYRCGFSNDIKFYHLTSYFNPSCVQPVQAFNRTASIGTIANVDAAYCDTGTVTKIFTIAQPDDNTCNYQQMYMALCSGGAITQCCINTNLDPATCPDWIGNPFDCYCTIIRGPRRLAVQFQGSTDCVAVLDYFNARVINPLNNGCVVCRNPIRGEVICDNEPRSGTIFTIPLCCNATGRWMVTTTENYGNGSTWSYVIPLCNGCILPCNMCGVSRYNIYAVDRIETLCGLQNVREQYISSGYTYFAYPGCTPDIGETATIGIWCWQCNGTAQNNLSPTFVTQYKLPDYQSQHRLQITCNGVVGMIRDYNQTDTPFKIASGYESCI